MNGVALIFLVVAVATLITTNSAVVLQEGGHGSKGFAQPPGGGPPNGRPPCGPPPNGPPPSGPPPSGPPPNGPPPNGPPPGCPETTESPQS